MTKAKAELETLRELQTALEEDPTRPNLTKEIEAALLSAVVALIEGPAKKERSSDKE